MTEEKLNLKKALSPETLAQKAYGFGDKLARQLFGATVSLTKANAIVQNNYDLGMKHLAQGHLQDAIMRFKFVVWLEPKHAQAWYNLGSAYLADGKKTLAIPALKRAIALKPELEETHHMLAAALGEKVPEPAPEPADAV